MIRNNHAGIAGLSGDKETMGEEVRSLTRTNSLPCLQITVCAGMKIGHILQTFDLI